MNLLNKGLGAYYVYDPRAENYLMRSTDLLRELTIGEIPRSREYQIGPILDQGREGACKIAGTLVRMADGTTKPIEKISLLEKVVTAEGNIGTVLRTMVRYTEEGLIQAKLHGHGNLKATPNHPILTKRGYVPIADLQKGDEVALTKFAPEDNTTLNTESYITRQDFGRRVNQGIVGTGGVLTEVSAPPKEIPLSKEFGRLIGLFIAEGGTTANKVTWTFGAKEEHTLAQETVHLIRSVLGAEPRLQYRPNNSINVVLYGKLWRLLFERMFKQAAYDKKLPSQITRGPKSFLREIFWGWMDGDGHQDGTRHEGVTVSHSTAMDMYNIAQSCGLMPTFRKMKPSINRHAKTRRDAWVVGVSTGDGRKPDQDETHCWRKVQLVEHIPFTGYVYNMHVEGDESYVAEGVGVHNCVGFAWTAWRNCAPVVPTDYFPNDYAIQVYRRATEIDEWPGENWQNSSGTSNQAGAKIMREEKALDAFVWGKNPSDMRLWLLTQGPVVFTCQWRSGMYQTDAQGFLHARGNPVGGHALLCYGIDNGGNYLVQNSWGEDFGIHGTCKISQSTMDYLHSIGRGWSACSAVELEAVKPPDPLPTPPEPVTDERKPFWDDLRRRVEEEYAKLMK